MLIGLAMLALFAVLNSVRGRRSMEASFRSWIGAMLFATIAIRNFFPGKHPGS